MTPHPKTDLPTVDAPKITQRSGLSMQVCVDARWTDEQVKEFADRENVCGTEYGWQIRKQGDPALAGANERMPCAQRGGCVHIMLDA
jgi:hypothetical protein